jgi:hypothetical protein
MITLSIFEPVVRGQSGKGFVKVIILGGERG